MTKSSLTDVTILSPNCYRPRAYSVTKITPHHMAGNLSVERCGEIFQDRDRNASSNYGIGTDGRIACYVEEQNAAWTSSSWENDNRAITFEIANNDTDTWSISDAAWDSTVALCVDICRRYGIERLNYTGDSSGNLTEHRMFASTACPGPWLHARMGMLADEVNEILEGDELAMASPREYAEANYSELMGAWTAEDNKKQWGADGKGSGSGYANGYNIRKWNFENIIELKKTVAAMNKTLSALNTTLAAINKKIQ